MVKNSHRNCPFHGPNWRHSLQSPLDTQNIYTDWRWNPNPNWNRLISLRVSHLGMWERIPPRDGPGPDVSADDHHRRSCCRKEKPNRLQGASLPECGARQGVSECYARPLLSLHAVISRSFEKFNACRVFTVQPRCEWFEVDDQSTVWTILLICNQPPAVIHGWSEIKAVVGQDACPVDPRINVSEFDSRHSSCVEQGRSIRSA